MTTSVKAPKKLIEVALPLDAINEAAAREKSIRHGHPSTLHLWWARRPLAAARAVIFSQMVNDPSWKWEMEHPGEIPPNHLKASWAAARNRLFVLITELVQWENTTNEEVLERARAEIRKSWRETCEINRDHPPAAELFDPEKLPAFHDPFAGGGSLPLEAQRLGLEAHASDLNPVAVLINKAMIEIPPMFAGRAPVNPDAFKGMLFGQDSQDLQDGEKNPAHPVHPVNNSVWRGAQGLAEDVRYYGKWMRDEAEKRIGHLYPKIEITAEMASGSAAGSAAVPAAIRPGSAAVPLARPDLIAYVGRKLTVIAWLWARTVKSPNPAFAQVDVPLASTFMLSTKPGKEAYVEPVILGTPGSAPGSAAVPAASSIPYIAETPAREEEEAGGTPALPGYYFTVKVGEPKDAEAAKSGTKLARGANFRCIMSGTPIAGDYIKAEGRAGRMGARLMAIVAEGDRGRIYLSPTIDHEIIVKQAKPSWKPELLVTTPCHDIDRLPMYGMFTWGDAFTPRQLVALTTFSDLVQEARERVERDFLGASPGARLGARPSRPQMDLGAQPSRLEMDLGAVQSHMPDSPPLPHVSSHQEKFDHLKGPIGNAGCSFANDGGRAAGTAALPGAHLGAQPGAQPGTQPSTRTAWHSRGYLPHFEGGEIPQTVTFRLGDSLPVALPERWERELAQLDKAKRDLERRKRIEKALDQSHGACWMRNPVIAEMVQSALLCFDHSRYCLHAWCIMPNHVHALFTPLAGLTLSSILHSWKSYTAHQADRILGRQGRFWEPEYFDRYIRDENHWFNAILYIHENPVKAGLCQRTTDWPWSSAGSDPGSAAGSDPGSAAVPAAASITYISGKSVQEEEFEGGTRAFSGTACSLEEAGGTPALPGEDDVPLAEGGTGARAYAEAVGMYLAFGLSKMANIGSSIASWMSDRGAFRETFARQAIPMVWDYAEANTFADTGGSFTTAIEKGSMAIDAFPSAPRSTAEQADAALQTISIDKIVSTDPPYYDNIGYADLSDFFYVWLRRSLKSVFPDLFATLAVPKAEELVATPYRHGNKEKAGTFFLDGMTQAMHRLAEQAHSAFPVTIYYAFKQAESDESDGTTNTGWDTFLAAVIEAGFAISGTWPMRTEGSGRMIAMGTNALASSIVLVCRKRPDDAPVVSRREFLRELNRVLPEAVDEMTRGAGDDRSPVAPVDLSQAVIGPGMAVFSKYAAVLEADGTPMDVRTALRLINRFLAEDDFDRDTQFCLHWFEQCGWGEGSFGDADVLARAKATSVGGLVEAGVVESGGGKVRLRRWPEYPDDWDPRTDTRLPVWEALHHLIRLVRGRAGETGAGEALEAMSEKAEGVRQLAYRLYTLCERRGWAEDARAYNELITTWSGIEAATIRSVAPAQHRLFE